MIQRADPGPTVERGRAWIPAPTAAAAAAAVPIPRRQSSFRTRHPSFAASDASQSLSPTESQVDDEVQTEAEEELLRVAETVGIEVDHT